MEIKKKKINKNSYRYKYDKAHEKVEGTFHFYEVPSGTLTFSIKAWKGDQVENYKMIDGERYTVPRFVATHLEENGWYPEHSFMQTESGTPVMRLNRKVQRFGFTPIGFTSVANEKSLYTIDDKVIEEVVTMEQRSLK